MIKEQRKLCMGTTKVWVKKAFTCLLLFAMLLGMLPSTGQRIVLADMTDENGPVIESLEVLCLEEGGTLYSNEVLAIKVEMYGTEGAAVDVASSTLHFCLPEEEWGTNFDLVSVGETEEVNTYILYYKVPSWYQAPLDFVLDEFHVRDENGNESIYAFYSEEDAGYKILYRDKVNENIRITDIRLSESEVELTDDVDEVNVHIFVTAEGDVNENTVFQLKYEGDNGNNNNLEVYWNEEEQCYVGETILSWGCDESYTLARAFCNGELAVCEVESYFTVTKSNTDQEPPIIDDIWLEVNDERAEAGVQIKDTDKVVFYADVTDASPIERLYVDIRCDYLGGYEWTDFYYDELLKCYVSEVDVSRLLYGTWEVDHYGANDKYKNSIEVYEDNDTCGLMALYFCHVKEDGTMDEPERDMAGPEVSIKSITPEHGGSIEADDKITMDVVMTDDGGLRLDNSIYLIYDVENRGEERKDCESVEPLGDDTYRLTFGCEGSAPWDIVLKSLHVRDMSDNETEYTIPSYSFTVALPQHEEDIEVSSVKLSTTEVTLTKDVTRVSVQIEVEADVTGGEYEFEVKYRNGREERPFWARWDDESGTYKGEEAFDFGYSAGTYTLVAVMRSGSGEEVNWKDNISAMDTEISLKKEHTDDTAPTIEALWLTIKGRTVTLEDAAETVSVYDEVVVHAQTADTDVEKLEVQFKTEEDEEKWIELKKDSVTGNYVAILRLSEFPTGTWTAREYKIWDIYQNKLCINEGSEEKDTLNFIGLKFAVEDRVVVLEDSVIEAQVALIEAAASGATLTVDMTRSDDKIATVVPSEFLAAIQGKDITLVLNMGTYSWSIEGDKVESADRGDVNLEVLFDVNAISQNGIDKVTSEMTEPHTLQLYLMYSEWFGFHGTVTVLWEREYAGETAEFYRYHADSQDVEWRQNVFVAADGTLTLDIWEGKDYIVAVDTGEAVVYDQGELCNGFTWGRSNDWSVIKISGTGEMYNWTESDRAPWYDYADRITEVIIEGTVTNIGDYAFDRCQNLTKLTLPDTITRVGNFSFHDCNKLNTFDFSRITELGTSAFQYTALTHVELPACLESVGLKVFDGCNNVTAYSVADGNPYYYSDTYGALFFDGACEDDCDEYCEYHKRMLAYPKAAVYVASYKIPDGIQTIEGSVFSGGNVGTVVFPASMKAIRGCEGNSFTSIEIPDTVTVLGQNAFNGSKYLTSITIPGSVKEIQQNALSNMPNLKTIAIEDGTIRIWDYAVTNNAALETIIIPASVAAISEQAFENTNPNLVIKGYTNSMAEMFAEMRGLTFESIGSVEETLFDENSHGVCGAVDYEEDVTWKLYNNGTLVISGNGPMKDYTENERAPWLQYYSMSIVKVVFEEGITHIGAYAMDYSESLIAVEIADSVTSIGARAFKDTRWANPVVPKNVTEIGEGAFHIPVEFLKSLSVEEGNQCFVMYEGGLYDIGRTILLKYVYNEETSNGKVVLPDTLKIIDVDAFCGSPVPAVVLPEGLEEIRYRAFYSASCSDMEEFYIPSTVKYIGELGVAISNMKKFTVGSGSQYFWADERGALFTADRKEMLYYPSVNEARFYAIPDGVEVIHHEALGFDYLEGLLIPKSVKIIDRDEGIWVGNPRQLDNRRLLIYGYENSYAEEYVRTCPYEVEALGGRERVYATFLTIPEKNFKRFKIACPVDVIVIDKSTGEIVASVVAESVDECGATIYADDDMGKTLYLENDIDNYEIIIDAYGSGTVSFYIEEDITDESGNTITNTIEFKDIPITEDDVLTSQVGMLADEDEYVVTRKDGSAVLADVVNVNGAGEQEATLELSSAALVLHNNLAMQFKADETLFVQAGYENPYIVVGFNGKQTTISNYSVGNGKYIFEFTNIAPHQMGDTMTATLYATKNGELVSSEEFAYSVSQYCYAVLNAYTSEEYASLRTLIVDLLNYGSVTQTYNNYNTGNLVNCALTSEQAALGTSGTLELKSVLNAAYEAIDSPTVTWKSVGLELKDSVTVRYKIDTESIDGLSVKIKKESDSVWTTILCSQFEETEGGYYIYFDGVKASQMSEDIYAVVYSGDTAVSNTLRYSVESYAYAVKDGNDTLADLVIAMMKYGNSAKTYYDAMNN